MSQKNLARQWGIDPATLGKIELNRKLPSNGLYKDFVRILESDSEGKTGS